jgi:hypothetical protein
MILGKIMGTKKENNNRYFYVELGETRSDEVNLMAEITIGALKLTENFHTVTYLTNDDNSLYVKEITEDEFLEHHKKENA